MKSIEIRASLPFSWCRFCTRMDLETQKWMADGRVEEIENVCANAALCQDCVRAWSAGLDAGEGREDGKDQAAPMTNAEYLRRVLPALSDQAMLNLLRSGIECCDCPMDQDCRRNAEEAYTKGQAPRFTCGDWWEHWMEEAVK